MHLESVIEAIVTPLIIVKKDRTVLLVNEAFMANFLLEDSTQIIGKDSYTISPSLLVKGDYSETTINLNHQQYIVSMNVRNLRTVEAGTIFISNIHSTEACHPGNFTFRESKMLEQLEESGIGTCFVHTDGIVSSHTPNIQQILNTSTKDIVGTNFSQFFTSHGNRKLKSVVKSLLPQTITLAVDTSHNFSETSREVRLKNIY